MCTSLCAGSDLDSNLQPWWAPAEIPEAQDKPLANMSLRERLDSLAQEFRFNQEFGEKVRALEAMGYRGWRRIRGDGNCFYRALGFGLLERLAAEDTSRRAEWGEKICHNLAAVRMEDPEHQAAHEDMVSRVRRLVGGLSWDAARAEGAGALCEVSTPHALHRSMRAPGSALDLALIRALRALAAACLRKLADDEDANGGISYEIVCQAQGYRGVEDFCQRVVLPMGTEAEGVVLDALPAALGVGLRIAFLDRGATRDVAFCDYNMPEGFEEASLAACFVIHLQLRPGHYDLLYFGSESGDQEEAEQPMAEEEEEEEEESVERLPSLGCDDGTMWTRKLLHIDTQHCYASCVKTGCL